MPRIVVLILGLLALVLVASQLVLPSLTERQAEQRLEEGGGQASVKVHAFPALRLPFGDGDSFEAEGRGLRVDVGREGGDLDRLDGFDEVHVRLDDLDAGPLAVSAFRLDRAEGAGRYDLHIGAVTTPREVASFLGSQTGGALGGLFGSLAGGLAGGDAPVPLRLRAKVESRDGRAMVSSASGSVAGIPAGPLAELVVAAVIARI